MAACLTCTASSSRPSAGLSLRPGQEPRLAVSGRADSIRPTPKAGQPLQPAIAPPLGTTAPVDRSSSATSLGRASLRFEPIDFVLPAELEAVFPPTQRDCVRLLVTLDGTSRHAAFADLANQLAPGDLLVVNDSATLPAAVPAWAEDGSRLTLHFSTPLPSASAHDPYHEGVSASPSTRRTRGGATPALMRAISADTVGAAPTPRRIGSGDPDGTAPAPRRMGSGDPEGVAPSWRWIVEPRQYAAREGEVLNLSGGARATLLRRHRGQRLWVARLDGTGPVMDYLQRHGGPVRYPYLRGEWPMDAWQTIFAHTPGSAEMPSAGRPFTPRVLQSLHQRGVEVASLTLHTGVASLERDESPYAEWYDVPAETLRRIEQTWGRVIAVGTTVVRALESTHQGLRGWTERVIEPDQRLTLVDGLITGLHEPRASHLQMLRALCDDATLFAAYQTALDAHYLWHEFGDLHLILPPT